MVVLTVGRPDAFEEVGVRAAEVVFVLRRGFEKDIPRSQARRAQYVGDGFLVLNKDPERRQQLLGLSEGGKQAIESSGELRLCVVLMRGSRLELVEGGGRRAEGKQASKQAQRLEGGEGVKLSVCRERMKTIVGPEGGAGTGKAGGCLESKRVRGKCI